MTCPFFGIKGVMIVGYSMIEMIDNRLDQLFSQRDLYTFSPFSVEDLRDNIIMFIIKDAYAESERKKSLRANRGTDSNERQP